MELSLKDRLLLRKPVDEVLAESRDPTKSLAKRLTALDLVVLGVGAIIGVGIFVLAGVGAQLAGPGIALSFVVAGLVCALAGLCYAELASSVPTSGSAYAYTYMAMGESIAWVLGWALVLEYAVGSVAVAIGWSGYVQGLLGQAGIELPAFLGQSFLANTADNPGGFINLPAVLIVGVITLILVKGAKESARAASALVILKLAVVIFVIAAGFLLVGVKGENFNVDNRGFLPFGFGGVMAGAAIVFFAYIGFDAVSTTAEEAKNPGRDLPIGILGSLAISTFLYILATLVLVGVTPWTSLTGDALVEPFAFVFREAGAAWVGNLIAAGAVAGITSVLMVLLMGGPRVFFALARDGLLPRSVSKVHPKFGTPYVSTLATGAVVALAAGFIPLGRAAQLTNIGTLFAFFLVCISVPLLRRSRPDLNRPFRVPLSPILPILGAFGTLALAFSLDTFTHYGFVAWMGAGLILYALYGIRRSRALAKATGKEDPEVPEAGFTRPVLAER